MRQLFFIFSLLVAAPSMAVEQQAAAEQLQPTIGVGSVLQVFVALLVVVGLILATAWMFRRLSGGSFNRNGALKVLAGIHVGQRERVVLVQAGEVQLLLGVAHGEVRTLHVFDKRVLVDTEEGKGAERFAERLMSAMNANKGEQK